MPDPTSLPLHRTPSAGSRRRFPFLPGVPVVVARVTLVILLVGGVRSIVFSHVGVAIAALVSKTIVALLEIRVRVGRSGLGFTLNVTDPSPLGGVVSGGRKPSSAPLTGAPVVASNVVNVQPECRWWYRSARRCRRSRCGRTRSILVVQSFTWAGGVAICVPNATGPRLSDPTSSLVLSSSVHNHDLVGGRAGVGMFEQRLVGVWRERASDPVAWARARRAHHVGGSPDVRYSIGVGGGGVGGVHWGALGLATQGGGRGGGQSLLTSLNTYASLSPLEALLPYGLVRNGLLGF